MIQHLQPDKQSPAPAVIICTGDIVLDEPDPDYWLDGIAPAFAGANLVIGHLEVPHTEHADELVGDVPAPGAPPGHLAALSRAGFNAMTLAGNHIADCGPQGIADTRAGLDALGIAHCGAGPNLAAARRPAILETGARAVAVLSYNCVGPENAWAGTDSAGCAYLPVATANRKPVTPAQWFTQPLPQAHEFLSADIARARSQADLVIVALHKGKVHTPAVVEDYERALARMAIDCGADIVIGHHAHIIRGIEFYRGKPIYHGLGNGCVVTRALSPGQDHPARAAWVEKRKVLFGFEPDPAYVLAPFHPDAVQGFMAKILWHADGSVEAGIIPVVVDPPGKPRLASSKEAGRVRTYLETITRDAGLGELAFRRGDDRILVA